MLKKFKLMLLFGALAGLMLGSGTGLAATCDDGWTWAKWKDDVHGAMIMEVKFDYWHGADAAEGYRHDRDVWKAGIKCNKPVWEFVSGDRNCMEAPHGGEPGALLCRSQGESPADVHVYQLYRAGSGGWHMFIERICEPRVPKAVFIALPPVVNAAGEMLGFCYKVDCNKGT